MPDNKDQLDTKIEWLLINLAVYKMPYEAAMAALSGSFDRPVYVRAKTKSLLDKYIAEFKPQLLELIATEVAEAKNNLLKGIANNNYAPVLGTYDYDGIAEDVLAELEKL